MAILGVSITLGPYGQLVARTTECVWEICVSNALMYGIIMDNYAIKLSPSSFAKVIRLLEEIGGNVTQRKE